MYIQCLKMFIQLHKKCITRYTVYLIMYIHYTVTTVYTYFGNNKKYAFLE